MEKYDRKAVMEKIKKAYPDNEIRTLKNGQRRFIANIRELDIPDNVKGLYGLRLFFNEDKVYLSISIPLGLDPKVKENREKERTKLRDEIKAKRNSIKVKINSLKSQLREEFKNQNFSALDGINADIETLKQELLVTRMRKKPS